MILESWRKQRSRRAAIAALSASAMAVVCCVVFTIAQQQHTSELASRGTKQLEQAKQAVRLKVPGLDKYGTFNINISVNSEMIGNISDISLSDPPQVAKTPNVIQPQVPIPFTVDSDSTRQGSGRVSEPAARAQPLPFARPTISQTLPFPANPDSQTSSNAIYAYRWTQPPPPPLPWVSTSTRRGTILPRYHLPSMSSAVYKSE
jgi:hypothetical protein